MALSNALNHDERDPLVELFTAIFLLFLLLLVVVIKDRQRPERF